MFLMMRQLQCFWFKLLSWNQLVFGKIIMEMKVKIISYKYN